MKLALPGTIMALALFSSGVTNGQERGIAEQVPPQTDTSQPDTELPAPAETPDQTAGQRENRNQPNAPQRTEDEPVTPPADQDRPRNETADPADDQAANADRTGARGEATLCATIEASDDGGLRVQSVEQAGLAAESGLREGDVITSVDGQQLSSQSELDAYLRDHQDARIPITVMRNGREQELFVNSQVRAQARAGAGGQNRAALGVHLRSTANGVAISRVVPGSPAARAGLRAGDRIVSLNGERFTSVGPFVDAAGRTGLRSDADLVYIRNGQRYQTTFRPAVWDDVYADAGEGFETRQALRPELVPPPPNGGTAPQTYTDDGSAPPPQAYNGGGYSQSTYYRGGYNGQGCCGTYQPVYHQSRCAPAYGAGYSHGGHFHSGYGYHRSQRGYYDDDWDDDDWEDRYDD